MLRRLGSRERGDGCSCAFRPTPGPRPKTAALAGAGPGAVSAIFPCRRGGAGARLGGISVRTLVGADAHVTALVFLLSVVVLALFVGRGPTLVAATMSALLWDYFFLPPIYAFRITHLEDGMLLGTYFVVALVLGQLTARIRAQEEAERQREERATDLYLLTRELTEATDVDSMLHKVMQQMERAFKARLVVLVAETRQPDDARGLIRRARSRSTTRTARRGLGF